jgi:hypothetical protein
MVLSSTEPVQPILPPEQQRDPTSGQSPKAVPRESSSALRFRFAPRISSKRLAEKVDQIRIDMGAYRFQNVECQAVATGLVGVKHAQSWVKPYRSGGEPSFSFEHRVEVIEN